MNSTVAARTTDEELVEPKGEAESGVVVVDEGSAASSGGRTEDTEPREPAVAEEREVSFVVHLPSQIWKMPMPRRYGWDPESSLEAVPASGHTLSVAVSVSLVVGMFVGACLTAALTL